MSDSIHDLRKKLSFDVKQHPSVRHEEPLGASVKVSMELGINHNLQPGESLVGIIQNADGEVIASGDLDVCSVAFVPIVDSGDVLGMARVHKAKLAK